jgi:hypothetical protein
MIYFAAGVVDSQEKLIGAYGGVGRGRMTGLFVCYEGF